MFIVTISATLFDRSLEVASVLSVNNLLKLLVLVTIRCRSWTLLNCLYINGHQEICMRALFQEI